MSDAFVMLLMGGAYTVIVFVLGMAIQRWLHSSQQAYTDMREQALIEALSPEHGRQYAREWSIPDDEQ